MSVQIFEIGGCVRDKLLGVPSKDIDYTCIASSFEEMSEFISNSGLKIVVSTPEYSTIRAITPKSGFRGHQGGLDFVWAREDGPYTDGRRPDWTRPADLATDQRRRDFTMNSIAKDDEGNLIDPFNGVADIENKIIRAVGDPYDRIAEDALRAVRALRFSVTKGFDIDDELHSTLQYMDEHSLDQISDERVREELSKMFRFDSLKSINTIWRYHGLAEAIFAGDVSLDATMKLRGRGK